LHQAEPFGKGHAALHHDGSGFPISHQLMSYTAIMKRVRKAIWMIEFLGDRNRLGEDTGRAVPVAGQVQRGGAL
jgi:hypothetical protein